MQYPLFILYLFALLVLIGIALGVWLANKLRPTNSNTFFHIGCLWSFLLWAGGLLILSAIANAICFK